MNQKVTCQAGLPTSKQNLLVSPHSSVVQAQPVAPTLGHSADFRLSFLFAFYPSHLRQLWAVFGIPNIEYILPPGWDSADKVVRSVTHGTDRPYLDSVVACR